MSGTPLSEFTLDFYRNLIKNDWLEHLEEEFNKDYFLKIHEGLKNKDFYPPTDLLFQSINMCPLDAIKVVIIGQDPYHGPGQAMGLSFSVPMTIKIPPSLKNIYKEMKSDIEGFKIPNHGDLTAWATQGVLLLNDTLTVERNRPGSHSKLGWKIFTTEILKIINQKAKNVVFILWGNHAKQKKELIDTSKHLILEAGHPSPFSAKLFFGCKHFSKTNIYLKNHGIDPIDWNLS